MRLRNYFLLLALPLTGITTSLAQGKEASQQLNVYTSRHYDADVLMAKNFEKKTGIKVNLIQIKEASQLIARVQEEKDKTQADLVITVDVGNLWRAAESGVFQPFESKVIEKTVPAAYRDATNLWTGFAVRVRLLAFNKQKLKAEQLSKMEDLAQPSLKGRVLVRSSNHVYNQSLAATLLASGGKDALLNWAKGVTGNLARKPQGGDTDQLKAIAAGEGDVAIVNSYSVARLLDSENPKDRKIMENISIVFPDQGGRGAHANLSGGGITKYSKNKANAVRYLEYLVSEEGQKEFSAASKEYPVLNSVPVPTALQKYGRPKLDLQGISLIGKHTPDALRILDEVGWR